MARVGLYKCHNTFTIVHNICITASKANVWIYCSVFMCQWFILGKLYSADKLKNFNHRNAYSLVYKKFLLQMKICLVFAYQLVFAWHTSKV